MALREKAQARRERCHAKKTQRKMAGTGPAVERPGGRDVGITHIKGLRIIRSTDRGVPMPRSRSRGGSDR